MHPLGVDPADARDLVTVMHAAGLTLRSLQRKDNALAELEAKRLQVLHELMPPASIIGILANPNFPDADNQRRYLQTTAQAIAKEVVFFSMAAGNATSAPPLRA